MYLIITTTNIFRSEYWISDYLVATELVNMFTQSLVSAVFVFVLLLIRILILFSFQSKICANTVYLKNEEKYEAEKFFCPVNHF